MLQKGSYLGINHSEAIKHVAFCYHSREDQISSDYLKLFDQKYNRYLNSVYSEFNYCASITSTDMKK